MEPITLILLGAGGYYVWKKNENPEWSPLAWLTSTPHDKHLALERVKIASVPTPAPTAALDPGMSTDQVKQVNHTLANETEHEKIKAHADALDSLGHASSAAALDAKAKAVGEAKAHGASDAEIHGKQIEASAPAAAVGWGMPGYPFGDVSYGYSYHPPEHLTGIQSGPAIVGIQSGPAIVGIQSGPAIVGAGAEPHLPWDFPEGFVGWDGGYGWGAPWHHHHHHHRPWWEQQAWSDPGQESWVGWDLFAHGVPAGGGARPGWGHPQHHPQQQQHRDLGRHGRYVQRHGRDRWDHPQRRHEWDQWRHHRRFRRPEEDFIEEPLPEPEPELELEPAVYEEDVPPVEEVRVEHHRRHEPPPPPPPPQVSITPGTITNGGFPPIEWPEEFVGVAQYGGGGLVAEFPGVPQQAQPYGAPVGQYGQPYAQQPQYGEDLFQEYAQAIEPQLEAYYQQPQYQQPQYYPQQYRRTYHRPWGGGGYRRQRRWW